MPSHELSDLVVIHSQLGFGFLEALLDRPAQTAEPDQCFKPCTGGCITDKKAVLRLFVNRAPDQKP